MSETEKLKLYNKSDCETLINYYNNLLKNKLFGDSLKIRVIKVVSEEYSKSKYRVKVNTYVTNQNHIEIFQDIDSFCVDKDILNPEQVLANQD